MKVNGKMICSMDSELRHGMMDPNTKGITSMGKNKDMESIIGQMGKLNVYFQISPIFIFSLLYLAQSMMENGAKTKYTER